IPPAETEPPIDLQVVTAKIRCNWPGCHASSKWYMCRDHWYRVPADLWSGLSQIPGDSSAEYAAAHSAIQRWIAEHDFKCCEHGTTENEFCYPCRTERIAALENYEKE